MNQDSDSKKDTPEISNETVFVSLDDSHRLLTLEQNKIKYYEQKNYLYRLVSLGGYFTASIGFLLLVVATLDLDYKTTVALFILYVGLIISIIGFFLSSMTKAKTKLSNSADFPDLDMIATWMDFEKAVKESYAELGVKTNENKNVKQVISEILSNIDAKSYDRVLINQALSIRNSLMHGEDPKISNTEMRIIAKRLSEITHQIRIKP